MIRIIKNDALFLNKDWYDHKQYLEKEIQDEIDSIPANKLLNTSVTDLVEYFYGRYKIEVPLINSENILVDHQEKKIKFSGWDRHPSLVDGYVVKVEIPFSGDSGLFCIKPSTSRMVEISKLNTNYIDIDFEGYDNNTDYLKQKIDETIESIQFNLRQLNSDASSYNSSLKEFAKTKIEHRRNNITRNQNIASSLGYKLKERSDSQKVFPAPNVRRKIKFPASSNQPYQSEPILTESDYEHILEVLQNMSLVMERAPSSFIDIDEETLRQHFLIQLNGHYEGEATGETFNKNGKTDILIRHEGKNIFIGECKFWAGEKKLLETVDQLLRYSSWRDTKVALLIFSRNKDFSNVLSSIKDSIEKHPNFKKDLGKRSETSHQYLFYQPNDRNREMILTTLAFDIPKP